MQPRSIKMGNDQFIQSTRDQFAAKREEMFRNGLAKLMSEIEFVKQCDDEFMEGVVIPAFSQPVSVSA
jgi:hypothetical protein